MVRARKKDTAVATADAPDVFDEQIAARKEEASTLQAEQVVHGVAESTRIEPDHAPQHNGHAHGHTHGNGHAATVEKKKYTPPADPFGFESLKAGENRVQLLKS